MKYLTFLDYMIFETSSKPENDKEIGANLERHEQFMGATRQEKGGNFQGVIAKTDVTKLG